MWLRRAIGLSVVLLAFGATIAQEQQRRRESQLVAAVDELVKQQRVTEDAPGLAILIMRGNQPLFQKGYGLARLDARAPITPQTLFELASVSKTFTATAILVLHEKGKLSIDDDIRKHIPELPEYDRANPIRIRDLLRHISGLPDYMSFRDVPSRNPDYLVNEDFAAEFARNRETAPLIFPTGEKYQYNNSNYMLLGLIVQRASQQSYGEFLKKALFVPAGMKNTFVYESPDSVPGETKETVHAIGYLKAEDGTGWQPGWSSPPNRNERLLTVGDGGIWTNLVDMANWDRALRSNKLIKSKTMQMALASSQTADGQRNNYGLGWSIYPNEFGGLNGFGHDGNWLGFRTSYYRYIAADRTTVILSNRSDFDTDKFWYVLDAAIEEHAGRRR